MRNRFKQEPEKLVELPEEEPKPEPKPEPKQKRQEFKKQEKEKCPLCYSEKIEYRQAEITSTAGGRLKTEHKVVKVCLDCGWNSK